MDVCTAEGRIFILNQEMTFMLPTHLFPRTIPVLKDLTMSWEKQAGHLEFPNRVISAMRKT